MPVHYGTYRGIGYTRGATPGSLAVPERKTGRTDREREMTMADSGCVEKETVLTTQANTSKCD